MREKLDGPEKLDSALGGDPGYEAFTGDGVPLNGGRTRMLVEDTVPDTG